MEPRDQLHHDRFRGALGAVVDLQREAQAPLGKAPQ